MVPSSSAHWAVGRTTSASSAVSDRKMSETTRKSRASSRRRDAVDVRRRDHDVGGHEEQGPHAAGRAHPVEHLERGEARLRQLVRVDPPDRRHVRAVGGVGQLAVPGQLVGLLAVLAAALPVALAGDRPVPARGPPRQTEGQREVDERLGGVGPPAVLLGASGREDHRRRCGRQPLGRPVQVADGDPGDPLDPVRPVGRDAGAHRRIPLRALLDVLVVDPSLADRDVEHAVREGQVGAGHRLEVQRRAGGRRGAPRVDDDVPGARARGPRRRTAWPAASWRRGSSRRAGSCRRRRGRRAGRAARGRCRTRGCPRWRRTTCRTDRCSRSCWYARQLGRTCRTRTPSRWSGRRRRSSRPRRARSAVWASRMPETIAPRASSQEAGRNGLVRSPGTVRSSGLSRRCGWSRRSVAFQPFEHRPPRLVGKSGCGTERMAGPAASRCAVMLTPHCSEQYGQCVSVGSWVAVDPTPRCFWGRVSRTGARR